MIFTTTNECECTKRSIFNINININFNIWNEIVGDRILYHSITIKITGESYRLKDYSLKK